MLRLDYLEEKLNGLNKTLSMIGKEPKNEVMKEYRVHTLHLRNAYKKEYKKMLSMASDDLLNNNLIRFTKKNKYER